MKKILLPLLLITASMGTVRLNAYCFYNHSDSETITIRVHSSKKDATIGSVFLKKAQHKLNPGEKACWNWKSIDKNNRTKLWYWIAYKGDFPVRTPWTTKLGEGHFPIGGAVYFSGWTTPKGEFDIYYDGKPWKWRDPPWNHKSKPWN